MSAKDKGSKISGRTWAVLLLVGLSGQFAWTLENMYFNVFLYNTISTDSRYIAAMVAASAIVATLTTLLMGALSDRLGRRKAFIAVGYILWGFSTASFGFISARLAHAALLVVIMDCVMTFFGSTANDAAFNAYITDVIPDASRGKSESVLAILPLISMLVIFGLFDGMTQRGEWRKFFSIFGVMVSVVGVVCLFLVKDAPGLRPRRDSYFQNLLYGLRPAVVRENPMLYLALAALGVFSIAVQVFFPYLIIYIQNYLHIDNYAIVLGVVLLFASVVSVVMGGVIDRVGKLRFVLPAAAVMFAGLLAMFFVRGFAAVIAAGCVMMSGYMLVTAVLSGVVRDYTPEGKVGHFQGIRMIFGVLLPMIVGPFIGSAVIRGSGETYIDLGEVKSVPTPGIFLAAAVVLLLVLLPVTALRRRAEKAA